MTASDARLPSRQWTVMQPPEILICAAVVPTRWHSKRAVPSSPAAPIAAKLISPSLGPPGEDDPGARRRIRCRRATTEHPLRALASGGEASKPGAPCHSRRRSRAPRRGGGARCRGQRLVRTARGRGHCLHRGAPGSDPAAGTAFIASRHPRPEHATTQGPTSEPRPRGHLAGRDPDSPAAAPLHGRGRR